MKKFTPLNKLHRDKKVLFARFSEKLMPPNMQMTSWTYKIFPDNLWLALLLSKYNIKDIINDLSKLITIYKGQCKDSHKYVFFHSSLCDLPDELFDKLFQNLLLKTEYREQLESLLLFDNLPDKRHWMRNIEKTQNDEELWRIVAETFHTAAGFHSRISTSCGCFFTLCRLSTGSMSVAQGLPDPYIAIDEYVNFGRAQHESLLRSSLQMYYCHFCGDSQWNENFWRECFEKTECYSLPYDKIISEEASHDEAISKIRDIALRFHAFWTYFEKDTNYKYRDYAIIGLSKYSIDLCYNAIAVDDNITTESRIILRSVVEAYINLKYLLTKNDDELWKKYIEYGHGKAKQILTKYQDFDDIKNTISTPKEILHFIAEEGFKDPELYVDVNLGDFDGTDLRKRAIEGGTKEIYDQYYDILSTFSHSQWLGVRLHGFSICGNPLHRHHLLLNPLGISQELVDVTGEFCFFAQNIIEVINNIYDLGAEFEDYFRSYCETVSDFAIEDIKQKIKSYCDKYKVEVDIFCFLLKHAYNATTVRFENLVKEFKISKKEGFFQLKKMILVCSKLNIPNISMLCLNRNNMPYSLSFSNYTDCNTPEKRMTYFAFGFNSLVGYARSLPISILFSKPNPEKKKTQSD